jgi:hypothetical protein
MSLFWALARERANYRRWRTIADNLLFKVWFNSQYHGTQIYGEKAGEGCTGS